MNLRSVFYILGVVIIMTGLCLFLGGLVAMVMEDKASVLESFFMLGGFVILGGVILALKMKGGKAEFRQREAFATAALTWIVVAGIGALPFCQILGMSFCDGYFEFMSAITTTGASVIPNIDAIGPGMQFWRCFGNFLGGLGIVVLPLMVLPLMGVKRAHSLFKTESSAPVSAQDATQAVQSMKVLWLVYVGLSVVCALSLWAGGMSVFSAICHAMSVMGTGGNSIHADSYCRYSSVILYIATFFTYLGATNFSLHIRALRSRSLKVYWADEEWRLMTGFWLVCITLIVWQLMARQGMELADAHAHGTFQVVTIGSSCGYYSADFAAWPVSCMALLFICGLIGGCSGSTAGGLKFIRVLLLAKYFMVKVRHLIFPHSVSGIQYNRQKVEDEAMNKVMLFFFAYIGIWLTAFLGLSFVPDMDLTSAFTGSMACVGNVGPSFAKFGPLANFEWIPDWATWMLSATMLLGRLEIFTLMILFSPRFWRR